MIKVDNEDALLQININQMKLDSTWKRKINLEATMDTSMVDICTLAEENSILVDGHVLKCLKQKFHYWPQTK